jgi:hypothetical protein
MSKLDYSKITPEQRLAIDDVMDTFEFEKVERHMKAVNWGWSAPTPEDEWNLEIPTILDLKAACRRLLINAFTAVSMVKETDPDYKGPCYSSCGGFTVYAWPDNRCQVFFSVTDWWYEPEDFEPTDYE